MSPIKRVSDRSLAVLQFLWRWKLTSTSQIAASFCNGSMQVAYNTLWRLKTGGFVQNYSDRSGRVLVWTLTRKGFEAVRPRLPKLSAEGYLSETPIHDLIVQAIHLGPWGATLPAGVEIFTEQELRSLDKNLYPDWVPKSNLRRPDGYWRVFDGNDFKVTALEVELTRKDDADYTRVRKFYDLNPEVGQVVWVVAKKHQIEKIPDLLKVHSSSTTRHNFVSLDQFIESGWNAPVVVGPERGQTAQDLLSKKYQKTIKTFSAFPCVDTRRFPKKSRTSRECFSALLGD